jgi:hypothetical protein
MRDDDHLLSTRPRIHRVWRVGDHWCVVADNGMAFYLGYVSVPEGHPWHGQDWGHIDADAHGGITYSGERDENWPPFESDDGVPGGYFVGFDCGHFCCTPLPGSYMSKHWISGSTDFGMHPPWTIETVVDEVNRLAVQAQLAAVMATA